MTQKYEGWIEGTCHASTHHYETQHCHLLGMAMHGIPLSITLLVCTHTHTHTHIFRKKNKRCCKGMKNI